jgi:hypothetical protein
LPKEAALIFKAIEWTLFRMIVVRSGYSTTIGVFYFLAALVFSNLVLTIWVAIVLKGDEAANPWLRRCALVLQTPAHLQASVRGRPRLTHRRLLKIYGRYLEFVRAEPGSAGRFYDAALKAGTSESLLSLTAGEDGASGLAVAGLIDEKVDGLVVINAQVRCCLGPGLAVIGRPLHCSTRGWAPELDTPGLTGLCAHFLKPTGPDYDDQSGSGQHVWLRKGNPGGQERVHPHVSV